MKETLTIPYKWVLGKALSKFFTNTKNNAQIYGSYAPEVNAVNVFPKVYDIPSFEECTEWKLMPEEATLYSFTEVYMEFVGQRFPPPYHVGLIQVKGSCTQFFHIIKPKDNEELQIGQSLIPVWEDKEKRKGDLFDIKYWEPRSKQ